MRKITLGMSSENVDNINNDTFFFVFDHNRPYTNQYKLKQNSTSHDLQIKSPKANVITTRKC